MPAAIAYAPRYDGRGMQETASNIGAAVPPTAYSLTPPSRLPAVIAAGLLTLGGALYLALTYGSHPREGLLYMATVGLPLVAPYFIVLYGSIALAGRLARQRFARAVPAVILPACAVAALALAALGYRDSRPHVRFERNVLAPSPRSLRDLRVEKANTFSDGFAWGFSFRVAPEEFALLESRHGLRELVEQRARREKVLAESADDMSAEEKDDLFTEDSFLRRVIESYTRPPRPRFYRGGEGDRMLVVADEGRTEVTVFIDHFRRPEPPR